MPTLIRTVTALVVGVVAHEAVHTRSWQYAVIGVVFAGLGILLAQAWQNVRSWE